MADKHVLHQFNILYLFTHPHSHTQSYPHSISTSTSLNTYWADIANWLT